MQYIICPDQFSYGERSSEISPKQFTHQLKVLQKQNYWETMVCGVEKKSSLSFLEGITLEVLKWLSLLGAVKN